MQQEYRCHQQLWGLVKRYWEPNSVFGHGMDHACRAYRLGKRISDQENGDFLIIGAACYLMDSGLNVEQGRQDHKERSKSIARDLLPIVPELQPYQEAIITCVSYHDADDQFPEKIPIEAKIVRDCDTLDRMGSTGIRMTLKYGEWIKRQLYDVDDPTCLSGIAELDTYTMDYIRHLFTLRNWLSTESALTISNHKLHELECFMHSFLSLLEIEIPDYTSTLLLVKSLENQIGNPYGDISE